MKSRALDLAEQIGEVAAARREMLIRKNHGWLSRHDLEDCFSQATLELIARARRDTFQSERHIARALDQKFVSRVIDRYRHNQFLARNGDGARAEPLSAEAGPELSTAAVHADPHETLERREEIARLEEVAAELTEDQRLVLACQVTLGMDSREFCERFGWSAEKFRKVAQRARGRLRALLEEYELGERCRRLEADLLAYAANVATSEQAELVRRHLDNCVGCARFVRDIERASGRVAGVLPVPALGVVGSTAVGQTLAAKLGGLWQAITERGAEHVSSVGPVAKIGVAALCAAGVAVGGPRVAAHRAPAEKAAASSAAPAVRVVAEPTPPRPRQTVSANVRRTATPAVQRTSRPKRVSRKRVPPRPKAPASKPAIVRPAVASTARPVTPAPAVPARAPSSQSPGEFGPE